ncbi:MAG: aldose 1-epimerase family protein [Thermoproteota archaeon]|nr:aldose 1-epimerase family protein [Candidatus Brockarchaeota archaeon]
MIYLYGRDWGKNDILKRVGSMEQIAGVKIAEFSNGFERGVKVAIVRNGDLNFLVAIDRGMDIVNAEYKGVPLSWISPTGIVAPGFYEPEGLGWLRGFPGGLMTTCGVTYMGVPTLDNGESLGLHGRISYSPATLLNADSYWDGESYKMVLEGETRESKVFEPNIMLRRRITTFLGERRIEIRDIVTNCGWKTQPLMILYHINIGFPLLDEGAKFLSTTGYFTPRDWEAKEGAEDFARVHEPRSDYREKVYFHDMLVDNEGNAYAAIVNDRLLGGLGVYVKYSKRELPRFIQWKMLGEGTYVMGMEPANSLVMGRDKERAWGTLQYIGPQETKEFHIEIGILAGYEIVEFEEKIRRITRGKKPEMIENVEEFIKTLKQ